jgi:predicted DNA-binding transcriptional regulator YafY
MPKFPNQKLRLLHLMRILQEESDSQHTITLNEFADHLKQRGISFDRKSLYADVEALREAGMDIVLTKGSRFGYYWANRPFELAELKFLADAVRAARCLTDEKTAQLVGKLEKLACAPEAQKLRRPVPPGGRGKASQDTVFAAIDQIDEAIANDQQVSFKYYEYTLTKSMRQRRLGQLFTVSPYALHWDGGHYHLIADHPERGVFPFRVDKIADISRLEIARTPLEADLDPDQAVTVEFASSLIDVVIDRFGPDFPIQKVDDQHFAAELPVDASPAFLSWIFQFGTRARITQPEWAVARMKELVRDLHGQYYGAGSVWTYEPGYQAVAGK